MCFGASVCVHPKHGSNACLAHYGAGQGAFGNANASATSTAVAQATAQAIATAVAKASNSKLLVKCILLHRYQFVAHINAAQVLDERRCSANDQF